MGITLNSNDKVVKEISGNLKRAPLLVGEMLLPAVDLLRAEVQSDGPTKTGFDGPIAEEGHNGIFLQIESSSVAENLMDHVHVDTVAKMGSENLGEDEISSPPSPQMSVSLKSLQMEFSGIGRKTTNGRLLGLGGNSWRPSRSQPVPSTSASI